MKLDTKCKFENVKKNNLIAKKIQLELCWSLNVYKCQYLQILAFYLNCFFFSFTIFFISGDPSGWNGDGQGKYQI